MSKLAELNLARNLLIVAGGVAISAGAWWIYPPAGLLMAGLAAIALAMLMQPDEPDYE